MSKVIAWQGFFFSFFFYLKLEIIANLVATWFCKNWNLSAVVNVKFTILRQLNFANLNRKILKIKLLAKLTCLVTIFERPQETNWVLHQYYFSFGVNIGYDLRTENTNIFLQTLQYLITKSLLVFYCVLIDKLTYQEPAMIVIEVSKIFTQFWYGVW